MKTNYDQMNDWEIQKASYLILTAKQLGMDFNSYGEVNVNQYSGHTYIWLEDYGFTLYMPINCDLQRKDVYVLFTDFETGEETEESLEHFTSINDIYEFINTIKN
jgi:hypothetical protein